MRILPSAKTCGLLAGVFLTGAAGDVTAVEVKLNHVASGMSSKVGVSPAQRLALSSHQPPAVKALPPQLSAPQFALMKMGSKEAVATIAFVLDEPADKPARLFVDINANGDLTDDPAIEWTPKAAKGAGGAEYTHHTGETKISLAYGATSNEMRLLLFRFDPKDPARASARGSLYFQADYGREGYVAVGGKNFRAYLADRAGTGDYRGPDTQLLMDLNGDGKYDPRAETFYAGRPFVVAGATYEITGMTAAGNRFDIERAKIDLTGPKAAAFKVATMDGRTVNFPAAYKGRLVLLDFWATWCGPCVAEIPNLVAAHQKFRPQGFEILGVSLDYPDEAASVANFTRQRRMAWPQVYEGKGWETSLAKLYAVKAIPAAFLVDGDTGEVLASGSELRGAKLGKTVGEILAAKRPPAAGAGR